MSASLAQRLNGQKAIRHWRENVRPYRLRCDATARTTGERCGNLAINGTAKCRLHGGRTPKGKNWHRPSYVVQNGAEYEARLARKITDHKRAAKKRAARLAAMGSDEREAHEAWQASHQPGPPARRAERRRDRKQGAEIAAMLEKIPAAPVNGELQQRIDALRRQIEEAERPEPPFDIFG